MSLEIRPRRSACTGRSASPEGSSAPENRLLRPPAEYSHSLVGCLHSLHSTPSTIAMHSYNIPLLFGAVLSSIAALLHFACIPWGANGFRFLGAGEPIVSMSAAGHWYPPLVAFAIGTVLSVWAIYALSGAGLIAPLPYLRLALAGITAVYLLRALAFPVLKPAFPGNSTTFWLVTSAICLVIGLAHLVGLIQVWQRA